MSSPTRPRTQTQRGRSGKKWVGLNYKEKERAKVANGGVMPYTLSLVTSDFLHKEEWSEINLPDILFHIQPPVSKYEGVKVEDLIENGEIVVSDAADGHNIRYFEILPRNISLDVPGWLVEAWRRLDTRIGYQDILDRQYADPKLGLKKHTKNALQNHCRRECRKVLNAWVEYGRRDEPHRTEVEAIEGMSYENVQFNTTLTRSETFSNRLVKVRLERRVEDGLYYALPRKVTADNWRETTLPLDHFLPNSQLMEMTPSMHAAWEMHLILMERAAVHGHVHWTKLERSCLPVTWYDRTTVKSVPNNTYDGGCATCTWSLDREILGSPALKLELRGGVSATMSRKRRRSKSYTELWDLDNKPKAPKRRSASKLSRKRQNSGGDSSPTIGNVTFVETYRRDPEEYEFYSVSPNGEVREQGKTDFYDHSEGETLSNGDASDDNSEYDGNEENEGFEEDQGTPYSCLQSESVSSDHEEVIGMVSNIEPDDPFNSPSAARSYRRMSYNQVQHGAVGFASPSKYSSQAEGWLQSSNSYPPDPSSQVFDHSSSIGDDTLLNADVDGYPGYLPASVFSDHHRQDAVTSRQKAWSGNLPYETSFTSVTTVPGTSFSSIDANISSPASSLYEASHAAGSNLHTLPLPTTAHFSTGHLYPLPLTLSQEAFHRLSYPSPPQTATYQNQMPFNSSPPRRPETEWGWNQNRSRRHSDTHAALGLSDDFAGIGALEHDLTAISSYLDEQSYNEGLDLAQTAYAQDYADSHASHGQVFDNGEVFGQDHRAGDAPMGRMIDAIFDNDFVGNEVNTTTGPSPALRV